jgi:predicted PurR-regulated permease PerM
MNVRTDIVRIPWRTCIKVGITAFSLYLCFRYWPDITMLVKAFLGAAKPLIIGCAIAYVINILMSSYEKRLFRRTKNRILLRIRRPLCIVLSLLTLAAVVALVFFLIIPQLFDCIVLIFEAVPPMLEKLLIQLNEMNLLSEETIKPLLNIDWASKLEPLINMVTSSLENVINVVVTTLTSVFTLIVNALISVIFALYLLMGKDTIRRQVRKVMRRYMPVRWHKSIRYFFSTLNDCFRRYVIGQCTEAIILGLLCMVGMWIFRFPYASMVGALVAFTALIPIAGAYIGAIVGAFMILTVSPMQALLFLVYIVVLQQLEGNLIYPRVVGMSLGLPGIWVLAAVTIGGGMMGVLGMLLGVPLAATAYRLLKESVNRPLPLHASSKRTLVKHHEPEDKPATENHPEPTAEA